MPLAFDFLLSADLCAFGVQCFFSFLIPSLHVNVSLNVNLAKTGCEKEKMALGNSYALLCLELMKL